MKTSTAIHKQGKISSFLSILNAASVVAKLYGVEKIMSRLILIMVRVYQRYISPYKGFNCAHNQLYNQQSCSSYFCACITQYDLVTANNLLRQRLINCRQAYEILITNSSYQKSNRGDRDNNKHGKCWNWSDLGSLFSGCDREDCESCELGECEFCELGDCDLGGCDLS